MKFTYDLETNGLNSMEDRITCISILDLEGNIPMSFYGENESMILKQFFNAIKNTTELISFNGLAFDVIFLLRRALINKVPFPTNWKSIRQVDLKKIVNGFFYSYNKYEKGTLNDWSNILGMNGKETPGSEMKEAYEKKDWKKIKEHCEEDVVITKALYNRCKECNII